jgi:hypothetical protein
LVKKQPLGVCVIGLTLGLTLGAGLLIDKAQTGNIKKRDIFLAVCFLGLAHSVIEDTILILLLGADVMSILWGRLLFAFVIICLCYYCHFSAMYKTGVASLPNSNANIPITIDFGFSQAAEANSLSQQLNQFNWLSNGQTSISTLHILTQA